MSKIKNKWLDNMPANTIKGNDTSGSAVPKDLTVSEVIALLGTSIIESSVFACPVVETPSTIVRADSIDYEFPEVMYEYDSEGNLDIVCALTDGKI